MTSVYLAGPYTKGDTVVNVGNQIRMYAALIDLGFAPYAPTLNHFVHMMFPHSYEEWMVQDFEWVRRCDCVLRMEGPSKGANREIKFAKSLGKKIFYNISDLLDVYPNNIYENVQNRKL